MKETILLIHFEDKARLAQLKRALAPLRLRLRTVGPDQYDQPVGALAGEKTAAPGPDGPGGTAAEAVQETLEENPPDAAREPLEGELLVMAGLSGGRLDDVLAALRRAGLRIPYKAVLTAANHEWSVWRLYREIRAEHEAMNAGKR